MTNRKSPREIAELTGLHVTTVRRYAERGIIPSKRDFRGWLFFPDPEATVKRITGLLNGDIQLNQH